MMTRRIIMQQIITQQKQVCRNRQICIKSSRSLPNFLNTIKKFFKKKIK